MTTPQSEMTNHEKIAADLIPELVKIAWRPTPTEGDADLAHREMWMLITAALDAVTAQKDQPIANLKSLLKEVEWNTDDDGDSICFYCMNRDYEGHTKDCKLAAALLGGEDKTS